MSLYISLYFWNRLFSCCWHNRISLYICKDSQMLLKVILTKCLRVPLYMIREYSLWNFFVGNRPSTGSL